MLTNLRQKITISLALAVLVYLALGLYADGPRLVSAFAHWDWRWLPIALTVTLMNYALRFLRWHSYLRFLGATRVPPRESALIFLSGFSLTMTPGKMGEVLKSYWLKSRFDLPFTYTAPIVFIERLTDVIGMGLLASLGLTFFPAGPASLAGIGAALVLLVFLLQQRSLADKILAQTASLPVVARFSGHMRNLFESAYLMLRIRSLLLGLLLATLAWFCECLALLAILSGFGLPFSPTLLLQATFIYAGASLFGAVTLTPGGVGTTEGSMAILLQEIVALAKEEAVAAVFLVRLITLWFAILLGVLAMLGLREERSPVVPGSSKETVREVGTQIDT